MIINELQVYKREKIGFKSVKKRIFSGLIGEKLRHFAELTKKLKNGK